MNFALVSEVNFLLFIEECKNGVEKDRNSDVKEDE